MKRYLKSNLALFFAVLFVLWSCSGGSKETAKDKTASTEPKIEEAPMVDSWIDESEINNLRNTFVAEADEGELSNTWAEDAFAEDSGSELANSWVDTDGNTIYKKTDSMPEFTGGQEALFSYFKGNIHYPDDVEDGTVYVAFVVSIEGNIRDTRIVKGVKETMDKEALRLIKNMPPWNAGMKDGETANVVYGLPVIFRP